MATRYDNVADYSVRSASVPSTTSFTVMMWCYDITHAANNFYDMMFTRRGGSNVQFALEKISGNYKLVLSDDSTDRGVGSTTVSLNTWFHAAWVSGGTSANYGYLNGVAEFSNVAAGTIGTTSILLGQYDTASGNMNWNGRLACVKIWEAQLTAAEVLQEMYTVIPQRMTNLWAWYPMLPGATERLLDYSGNGRDLTAGGTLTDEDGPPVSWGAPIIVYPYTTPAAGGTAVPVFYHQLQQQGQA